MHRNNSHKSRKAGSMHAVVLDQKLCQVPNLSRISRLVLHAMENRNHMIYIILQNLNVAWAVKFICPAYSAENHSGYETRYVKNDWMNLVWTTTYVLTLCIADGGQYHYTKIYSFAGRGSVSTAFCVWCRFVASQRRNSLGCVLNTAKNIPRFGIQCSRGAVLLHKNPHFMQSWKVIYAVLLTIQ